MLILLPVAWMISCSGRSGTKPVEMNTPKRSGPLPDNAKLIKMPSPVDNSKLRFGEPIMVDIEPSAMNHLPDSVIISFDGERVVTLDSAPWDCSVPGARVKGTGMKPVKAVSYSDGKATTTITRYVVVLSDIIPGKYGYKIVGVYPHDSEAYTQGLFYDNGVLFEGTGREAGSTLREVELESGRVLRQLNLSPGLFGEGITLYDDRIYQVTWTSKIGFVYEKSTFKQLNKIYYQTQGWGLTTMDDKIVMSDGSNVLYFYEPEMFTVLSRIEVYDNLQQVDSLNELEYINGEIWANIWLTDRVARIDPATGRIIGYINLKGILDDPGIDTSVKVLNGIAHDKKGNRIFVTGKNWPKLFEIEVIK